MPKAITKSGTAFIASTGMPLLAQTIESGRQAYQALLIGPAAGTFTASASANRVAMQLGRIGFASYRWLS